MERISDEDLTQMGKSICYSVNNQINYKLLFVQWANGIKEKWLGFRFPFIYIYTKNGTIIYVYIYNIIYIYLYIYIYIYMYIYIHILYIVHITCYKLCNYQVCILQCTISCEEVTWWNRLHLGVSKVGQMARFCRQLPRILQKWNTGPVLTKTRLLSGILIITNSLL